MALELHAAGMLLRRGISRVSVHEARVFASTIDCFVRPGANLVTTRELLAEETALLAAVKAGHGAYSEVGSDSQWKFQSAFVAGNEEQTDAVLHVLKSRDLVTSIRSPAGSGNPTSGPIAKTDHVPAQGLQSKPVFDHPEKSFKALAQIRRASRPEPSVNTYTIIAAQRRPTLPLPRLSCSSVARVPRLTLH